jgi:hypothetical protein
LTACGQTASIASGKPVRPSAAAAAEGGSLLEKHGSEGRLYLQLGELFERYEALICATCGTRGLVAGESYVDIGIEVGGTELDFYFEGILTPVFTSAAGALCCAFRPGFADNGVPTDARVPVRRPDAVPHRRRLRARAAVAGRRRAATRDHGALAGRGLTR